MKSLSFLFRLVFFIFLSVPFPASGVLNYEFGDCKTFCLLFLQMSGCQPLEPLDKVRYAFKGQMC